MLRVLDLDLYENEWVVWSSRWLRFGYISEYFVDFLVVTDNVGFNSSNEI